MCLHRSRFWIGAIFGLLLCALRFRALFRHKFLRFRFICWFIARAWPLVDKRMRKACETAKKMSEWEQLDLQNLTITDARTLRLIVSFFLFSINCDDGCRETFLIASDIFLHWRSLKTNRVFGVYSLKNKQSQRNPIRCLFCSYPLATFLLSFHRKHVMLSIQISMFTFSNFIFYSL